MPKVTFLFAWYDLWIGAYWDRTNRRLYVLPVPCFGIVLHFPAPEPVWHEHDHPWPAIWKSLDDSKTPR